LIHLKEPEDRLAFPESAPRDIRDAVECGRDLLAGVIRSYSEVMAEDESWSPEDYGWVMVAEDISDLDWFKANYFPDNDLPVLEDAMWECCEARLRYRCYILTYVLNNDFGMNVVIPSSILSEEQKEFLADQVTEAILT
jgi:hypothetical protein